MRFLSGLFNRQRPQSDMVHAGAGQDDGVDFGLLVQVAVSEPDGPHVLCMFLGAGRQEDGFPAHARISPA